MPEDEKAAQADSRLLFEVTLPVRLDRIPTMGEELVENTIAEVIGPGGAIVRSSMALDKGEIIRFQLGSYETRAEVQYISSGLGRGMDGIQRLGLSFLDAPLPVALIPTDARLLPAAGRG